MIKRYIVQAIKKMRMNRIKKDILLSAPNPSEDFIFSLKRNKDFSLYETNIFCLDKNDPANYINTFEAYLPRIIFEDSYYSISDDKLLFSSLFGNYIEVPFNLAFTYRNKIIVLGNDKDFQTLFNNIVKDGGCFVKPRFGYNGNKAYKFVSNGDCLMRADERYTCSMFEQFLKNNNDMLVQNILKQGEYASSLYRDSINTIRIITVAKEFKDKHEIIGAVQRIGSRKSGNVDNFSQDGLSALIDIDTGELSSATSRYSIANGNRVFYEKHPDTGAQIKGLKVPNWSQIKEKLLSLIEKMPFFTMIAWDIVVKDDGFAVIEINMKSSLGVFQVHGGLRNKLLGQKYKEKGIIK